MEKNKTGQYLKYATGEIILVVIGILIALSINNWNQNRINKITEKATLKDLKEELNLDTLDLRWNLQMHKFSLKNELNLLDFLTVNSTISIDSINFTKALGYPAISALNTITYNSLVNNNPDLITNQKLKNNIFRHYNLIYNALNEAENRSTSYRLYDKLLPFFQKYFYVDPKAKDLNSYSTNSTDYIDANYERNKLIPKNIEFLKKDEEFKVVLSEVIFLRKSLISIYEDALKRINNLNVEIDTELKK